MSLFAYCIKINQKKFVYERIPAEHKTYNESMAQEIQLTEE